MWKKSSSCSTGSCAEVEIEEQEIKVRNNLKPDIVVSFTIEEWEAFLQGVKGGEFG